MDARYDKTGHGCKGKVYAASREGYTATFARNVEAPVQQANQSTTLRRNQNRPDENGKSGELVGRPLSGGRIQGPFAAYPFIPNFDQGRIIYGKLLIIDRLQGDIQL